MKLAIIVKLGATLLAGGVHALPRHQRECEQSSQMLSLLFSQADEPAAAVLMVNSSPAGGNGKHWAEIVRVRAYS